MVNIPAVVQIVERCQALFDDLDFRRRQAVEGGRTGAQGDRLHADLRPARADPRRGHAAGRHPRRRRPARGHPGRRVLPELHLPHSALDDRARADRPARLPRRHAVPVDLRRDPQPVRHVADPVQGQVRPLLRRSAELRGRDRRHVLYPASSRCCATTSASCAASPITDDELDASIRVYNDNRARCASSTRIAPTSRGRRRPRRSIWCCAPAWCCRRRSTRNWSASTSRQPTRCRGPERDNARVVLNGSFCEQPPLGLIKSIEMAGCYIVDDDFMLVTRWLLDDVPATAIRSSELSKAFLHRSATTAAKYDTKREDKGVYLLKQVKTGGAEGVIFAAPSFCDPALLERPMLQDVLAKHKVPLHGLQVRGEHRPDGADPRAGRHVRRFDQAVERGVAPGAGQCPFRYPKESRTMTTTVADARQRQEAAERPEGGRDVAAEGDDHPQLPRARDARASRAARWRRRSCRAT